MNKDDADAEAFRRQTIRNATDAVRRAQTALEQGRLAEANAWITRAHRLAPDDSTVQIVFAATTVRSQPETAIQVLRTLTERLPWHREAGLALCAALHRAGQASEAASALTGLLARLSPPASPAVLGLMGAICKEADEPGWIALDGSGRYRIGLASSSAGSARLSLDGVPAGSVGLRAGQEKMRALPEDWARAQCLIATSAGQALLGSGLRPAWFAAVDGFVSTDPAGGISGWARCAADQDAIPAIYYTRAGSAEPIELMRLSADTATAVEDERPRWRFALPAEPGGAPGPVGIVDREGRHLWGSPLLPGAERAASRAAARNLARLQAGQPDPFRPLLASLLPRARQQAARPAARRGVACDVVIPVYAGLARLDLCLRSVEASLPRGSRLVLVNDGSPDPAIGVRLAQSAGVRTVVLTHDRPRGFPAAVNAGLRHLGPAADRDVVILNADTVVPVKWLERLSAAAHSDPAIGSCTPMTNDGTIVSYPTPGEPGEMPDGDGLGRLNALCWAANPREVVDIPTGVGFCMLLKGACLVETGLLREDVFAQGYGEENDWCLRAAHLGWRHVAVPGVFVGHSGGRSFGTAKALLMERNAAVMEQLHPGYGEYIGAAALEDRLGPARRRIDRLRLLDSPGRPATALITHDAGGGVARFVAARCKAIRASGRRVIVLAPVGETDLETGVKTGVKSGVETGVKTGVGAIGRCRLSLGDGAVLPNLSFDLPGEGADLAALLRDAGVDGFEIHHLLGHHSSVADLPGQLGAPYDVFVHDYGHWCPRITLTSRSQRYCGEPLAVEECEDCIADLGSRYPEEVTVRGLRRQSAALLGNARRVAVACEDVAGRIRRQFPGVRPEIVPWEEPGGRVAATPSQPGHEVHVLVAGSIGVEKGYDVLLGCARDAARRRLNLRFTVLGHTIDDERLMVTGKVFVTGRFEEAEGLALARKQQATLGFLPSVCPETWSYALSLLFTAGLPVLAFALGAQGERVAQPGKGWLLPLGISPSKVNETLVSRGLQILDYSTRPSFQQASHE